jgi:hypothetical protein
MGYARRGNNSWAMPEEETIQGIRPEIADSLQKVFIFLKRGE